MSAPRVALTLAVAALAVGFAAPAAQAAGAPKLHTVEVSAAEEGPWTCGALTVTLISGSQVERTQAVQVGDVIHFNLVRNYRNLEVLGSDGVVRRATGIAHETVLLDATTADPEVISVREVGSIVFGGGVGRIHEVNIESPDVNTDTTTGSCRLVP